MTIKQMRFSWLGLALTIMLLSACGVRSTGDSKDADAPTPIYESDKRTVYAAVVFVFKTKFTRINDQDPSIFKVVGTETNWPGGDTRIEVTLRDASAGHVAVDVRAESEATGSPAWNKSDRDFHNFLGWLDTEMKSPSSAPVPNTEERLRDLDRLHGQGLITDEEYKAKRAAIIDHL